MNINDIDINQSKDEFVKLLEQTNSANSPVEWAGVSFFGLISYSFTLNPLLAS